MPAKKNTIDHLSKRVSVDLETGCWNWTGSLNRTGYAIGRYDGKTRLMHRVFRRHYAGDVIDGEPLDHLCRNTRCVNPKHLEPVTAATNTRRGNVTKLNEANVIDIRAMYDRGLATQQQIADAFGVALMTINCIIQRRTWVDGMPTQFEKRSFRHRAAEANTKLSSAQILEICSLRNNGKKLSEIAVIYGVDASYVSRIVNGKKRVIPTEVENVNGIDSASSGLVTVTDDSQAQLAE